MTDFGRHQAIAKKAVILARISSKEQEDGYSIDAQNHRSNLYCDRHNLTILKVFELVESSTQGDRRKFMEIIQFVKRQGEPIAIVADKVDRVQRSFKEYPLLDALIQEGKIELHFVTENYCIHKDSVSQERLMWSMGVMMAQSYVENLKDNVKRAFEQKIRQGGWIAMAPIGYINIKDNRDRGDITIDPERAPLIKRLFETYATGAHTIGEMHTKTIEWGLRNRVGKQEYLVRSQVHKVLTNPFYFGQMKIKDRLYPHCYEPIISKDVFDTCQNVMKGWNKKPFKWRGKEFIFRGLLKCASTGRTVTADQKTRIYASGKTAQWTYLRCGNPADHNKIMWVREDAVLKQAEMVLKDLRISPEVLKGIYAYLSQIEQTEQAFHVGQTTALQKERQIIQNRQDKLMDLLMDNAIDRKEYDSRKLALRNRQMEIESHITAHRLGDDGFKKALCSQLAVVSEAFDLFNYSTISDKRSVLNFVFANLSLKGDKLLYSFRKPFNQFADCVDLDSWLKLIDVLRTDPELRRLIVTMQPFKRDTDY